MKNTDKLKGIYIALTTINIIEINNVADKYVQYLDTNRKTYSYYHIMNSFNWHTTGKGICWANLYQLECTSFLKNKPNHRIAIKYLIN